MKPPTYDVVAVTIALLSIGIAIFLLAYGRMIFVVRGLEAAGRRVSFVRRWKIVGGALSIVLIGLFASLFAFTLAYILAEAALALLLPPSPLVEMLAVTVGIVAGIVVYVAIQIRLWRYQDAVERAEFPKRLGWR